MPHPSAPPLTPATLGDRIARAAVRALMVADTWVGLSWLIGRPVYTKGLSYHPAKEILSFLPFYPMRAWGGVLLMLAVLGFAATFKRTDVLARHVQVILSGYWGFWCFAFVVSVFHPNAPFTAVGFAFIALVAHFREAVSIHALSSPLRRSKQ